MPRVPAYPGRLLFTNVLCEIFGFWLSLRISRIRYPYQVSEASLRDPNLPLTHGDVQNLLMEPSSIQPQMELNSGGLWVTELED